MIDRARIHNEEKIFEAFRERGGHVMSILKMPAHGAKRMSPLDNALFHDWKEAIRKHGPLTLNRIRQVMFDASVEQHHAEQGRGPLQALWAHWPR